MLIEDKLNETMRQTKKKDLIDVYRALYSPVSYNLFLHMANNGEWVRHEEVRPFAKTEKIWYTSVSKLIKAGLIKRLSRSRYSLTEYGRIIGNRQKEMIKATENYYKLFCIENMRESLKGIPQDAFDEIASTILEENKSILDHTKRFIV
jgi:predicted transcriptional regulator